MDLSPTVLKQYMKDISRHQVMSKQEEYDLFARLRSGDESARDEIIQCNLRLVVRLAQRFQGKGLSLEDLIQEGNIGLLEVIDRFDHTLGFRFSTYAAFWIRQAIQVAVRKQGSLIRLPVRKARALGYMSEVIQEFRSTKGRAPTYAEMAERLGLQEEQLEELVQISKTALSLDSPLDEDGGTLQERVVDERTPLASQQTMRNELIRKVHQALAQLSERENRVLQMRFGIHGGRPRSLRSISRRVGLSQEGVRRVEQRALAKLARPHMRTQLSGLI
ncbi:MAG TPA: RNA polymerase sigma factor RpoD/SigA [Candidatus Sumerlaeota bacterium]|nr:MAG: RNA polymerase sigma factor SigA [candidate division BRC1 bacterium ADurb.BinA292]HOR29351.1 RNA polymerase sigma factor RpoD/SigA [Candidatus Sumerlaeota bacterium]HPK01702.1 RNA polymerase sigma factor RpoD/SigA [Candidatus Sumerlaeota bacterium]